LKREEKLQLQHQGENVFLAGQLDSEQMNSLLDDED
jgi:hypothetical protein